MIITVDQLMQRLQSGLGSGAVSADTDALNSHRIDGITPHLVVTPGSAEQIGAVLRTCSEAGATVIPWGGGTAMALGNPPRQADVVIKLEKLNRVIEHDAANLTVTAQCGMTLNALQSTLAAQKQFVPIDAPFPARATLGGIIAANLNGPRRSFYGSARDLVIGMKVVLASGESIKAGGKVVKNVAGYDMCKLFVGSVGTLGIITEATFRVAPAAESAATFIGRGTLAQTQRFSAELSLSRLLPAAAYLLNEKSEKDWRVAAWCEGFAETVERHLREFQAVAGRIGMTQEVARDENHIELWERLRDFPLTPNRLIYRVTLPRAAIFDFLERVSGWNSSEVISDTSMGTIWLEFPASKTALARFSEVESMARERRGHAVVFAAPAALKAAINIWGPAPPTISLMREIKRQFDPSELLNPGRFLGGI
ncbi:MAG: FAD-binding oxidoreductase [Candidatus Binatia bacterium]